MVLLFIVWSIEYCDTDKDKLESTEIKQLNDSSLAAPLPWSELNNTLQALLPCVDNVTYIIENYEEKPKYHFQGAPERNFDLIARINLKDVAQAKVFLDKMMSHSCCTYRVTRTSKSEMK